MKLMTAALAALALAALPALAQDDAAKADAMTKAVGQIKLADMNDDGKLSLAELREKRYALRKALLAAREDRAKTKELSDGARGLLDFQLFLAADVNNDRSLTAEELAGFELLESDNKRWRLSDADLELLAQEAALDKWEWAVARDGDGDGHLTAEEAGATSAKDKKEFAQADLDKDGLLSSYEYMSYGITLFKEKAKAKVERARAEFKDPAGPADPFALYKKKGRTWLNKTVMNLQNMDPMISYMKYEITEVNDRGATMKMYMLDKDKKPMGGMEAGNETRIEFRQPDVDGGRGPNGVEPPKVEDGGEIEAAGRKWRTQKTVTNSGGNETTVWMSTDLPGLIVKMEMKSENMDYLMTLEEFSDGE